MTLHVLKESIKKPSFTQYCEERWRRLSSQRDEAAQLQLHFLEMQGHTTHHGVLGESYTCISSLDESMAV